MEDLVPPRREPLSARQRRTALLAGAAALFLAVPLLALTFKRWKAVVPDQEEGFKPIAQISGRARETPRIELPKPKPAPVLASAVTLPAKTPAQTTKPSLAKPAPKRAPARPAVVKKTVKPAPKKTVAKAAPAPPPLARPADFYDLDFTPPPATETAPSEKPKAVVRGRRAREPLSLEPQAEPAPPQAGAKKEKKAESPPSSSPAVIVERVPSNDR